MPKGINKGEWHQVYTRRYGSLWLLLQRGHPGTFYSGSAPYPSLLFISNKNKFIIRDTGSVFHATWGQGWHWDSEMIIKETGNLIKTQGMFCSSLGSSLPLWWVLHSLLLAEWLFPTALPSGQGEQRWPRPPKFWSSLTVCLCPSHSFTSSIPNSREGTLAPSLDLLPGLWFSQLQS